MQYIIAEYEIRKMELITGLESKERLDYKLKKSIEQEDYEKAAEIRIVSEITFHFGGIFSALDCVVKKVI